MSIIGANSYKLRDAAEWTASEVREFIEAVLPGHPCVDRFKYTSGFVLCSLDKDDLRRQAADDEAAHVIYHELQGRRKGKATGANGIESNCNMDTAVQRGLEIAVYVQMRHEVAIEVSVLPSDTVSTLKSKVEELDGTPVYQQRMIFGGFNLQDERPLTSYGVTHGAVILMIRQLREQRCVAKSMLAPRGLLMVPGNEKWSSEHPIRPYMPVLTEDVTHGFPLTLEFRTATDLSAFVTASDETDKPVLRLACRNRAGRTLETTVHLDLASQCLVLGATTIPLEPGKTYDGVVHFGGRGGEAVVALVTGVLPSES